MKLFRSLFGYIITHSIYPSGTALSQADESTCASKVIKGLDNANVNLNGNSVNIRMQDKIFFTVCTIYVQVSYIPSQMC